MNSEIVIDVKGTTIKSIITNGSVNAMELKIGDEVMAIVKASQVIVAKNHPGRISTRNIIETKVEEVINGAVNCELKLSAGQISIAAIITEDAVKDLEINKGDTVFALIKANSIILAK